MQGTPITIIGNVVDDVAVRPTIAGVPRLSFRVVSTERRRDRLTGEWGDGHKLFITVTLWRDFAENVSNSIRKGDPVMVHGRIHSRQYVKDEMNKVSYEVDCDSIGHDLSKGTARFVKRARIRVGTVDLDEDGLPVRDEADGYELVAEDLIGAELDAVAEDAFAVAS